jgi:hypothetical protein
MSTKRNAQYTTGPTVKALMLWNGEDEENIYIIKPIQIAIRQDLMAICIGFMRFSIGL